MGEVLLREAARVLLVDAAGRLLLLRGQDPATPEAGSWWFTPGGGIEPGETAGQAAHRELWEETGLQVASLAGPVAERTTDFAFDGLLYRQHEVFFVARLPAREVVVVPASRTELETRAVLGWRWWELAQLQRTPETVHPAWLPRWLTEELAAAPPDPS